MSMILDISQKQQQLVVGFFSAGETVQFYDSVTPDWNQINGTIEKIRALIEQNCLLRDLSLGAQQELKKNGQVLFDFLIPAKIKERLSDLHSSDLTLQIAQELVYIPWELLFDGREFLCLRFNTGRCVKTDKPFATVLKREHQSYVRMLIIADPQGNLPAARIEASNIRQTMTRRNNFLVVTKTKNVFLQYLKTNIRDYDVLHYAGHAVIDADNPCESGWSMADGKMTSRDFMKLGESVPFPHLVFMNACQSVSSVVSKMTGEFETGLFGLANAFLMAGSRYVIGTFARVPDDAASEMAQFFYKHFSQEQRAGVALRKARQELLKIKGENDLTWAGYVLYGRPDGEMLIGSSQTVATVKGMTVAVTRVDFFRRVIFCGGMAFMFLFIACLIGLVVLRTLVKRDQMAGIAFYKQGDYARAKASFLKTLKFAPEKERVELFELLANVSVMTGSLDQVNNWVDKAHNIIGEKGDAGAVVRLKLLKAENTIQAYLTANLSGNKEFAQKLSLDEALNIYESARGMVMHSQDRALEAKITAAIAKVYRLKGDWPKAVDNYQKAVVIWEQMDRLSLSGKLMLLQVYLDLSWEYVDHPLDFTQAAFCLDKFKRVSSSMSVIPNEYRETVLLLQRRFELFLRRLARKGYKNSDLYKKAGVVYDYSMQLKVAE